MDQLLHLGRREGAQLAYLDISGDLYRHIVARDTAWDQAPTSLVSFCSNVARTRKTVVDLVLDWQMWLG